MGVRMNRLARRPGRDWLARARPVKVRKMAMYMGWLKYLYGPDLTTFFGVLGRTPKELLK